jgi:hypothetical protein
MELYIKKIDVEILDELIRIEEECDLPISTMWGHMVWSHSTKEINEKFCKVCHKEFVDFVYDTTFQNVHELVYNSINSVLKTIKPYQRSAQLRIQFYKSVESQKGFLKAGEMVAELVIDVDFV